MGVLAVLVIALILGLVLGNKGGDDPHPTPTPPTPVIPVDTGYNTYYLNDSDITTTKNLVSGVLTFNDTYEHENKEKFL